MSHRQRIRAAASALVMCGLLSAACGSQLSPQEAVTALRGNAATGQAGAGGLVDQGPSGSEGLSGPSDPGLEQSSAAAGSQAAGPDSAGSAGSANGSAPARSACSPGGAGDKGVSKQSITIANASDISGPVPGLFESSQQAVKAFVAYQNATFGGVCGRELELMAMDSRSDNGGDKDAVIQACDKAFAMVGSMSSADAGGAQQVTSCGIPDVRTQTVNPARAGSPMVFGANSLKINLVPSALPDYFRRKHPDGVKKAAYLYINVPAAKINAESLIAAHEKRGFTFVYKQGIDVADFNYSPYVQQMKTEGVKIVYFIGATSQAVRLAKAMQQQGFKPDAFGMAPTSYDPRYLEQAGAAAEGTYIYSSAALLSELGTTAEGKLYQQWLARVAPDATPTYYGVYAWAAARLFVEQTEKLGANPTRKGLLNALKGVRGYRANGLLAGSDVGPRASPRCVLFGRVKGGRFVREAPARGWTCGTLIDSGVGK